MLLNMKVWSPALLPPCVAVCDREHRACQPLKCMLMFKIILCLGKKQKQKGLKFRQMLVGFLGWT